MKKTLFAAALITSLFAAPVEAATLTGDTVFVDYNNGQYSQSGVVGLGNDVQIGGGLHDLDGGLNGDIYTFSWNSSYCGVVGCSGQPMTLTLGGLDFSGGAVLVGFNLLSSVFANTVASVLGNSVVITFNEPINALFGPGAVLQGQFVTQTSAVPVPAALPLLATGLGALGVVARRRRKKAA